MTLDYDVSVLLENAAKAQGRPKKHIVNEALRYALSQPAEALRPARRRPEILDPIAESLCAPIPDRADQSDRDALNAALADYFGLPAPPPRLYLVRGDA